jgi:peptidoglycan/LPS O-acetylase OafA/YrhL
VGGDDRGRLRLGGLVGLRAIAALAVFGVHFDQTVRTSAAVGPIDLWRLLPRGDHGVSLFFTLSGFLLALPFWRARLEGTSPRTWGAYAVRRLARIVPGYYLALTVVIFLDGYWSAPGTGADIALHYAFLHSFTEFSIFSINAPFWTIAVEMQFYLLLPFVLLAARRRGGLAVVVGIGGIAYGLHVWVMRSVTMPVAWPWNDALTWIRPRGAVLSHSLLAHLPHFLLGVAASGIFLTARARGLLERARAALVADVACWIAFIATILILGTGLDQRLQIQFGRYTLPVVPLLLTALVFATPVSRFTRALLDAVPLRFLGTISYGFYLYHVPCLNQIDRLLRARSMDAAEHWLLYGLGGFALTVIVATVSWFALERPVLRMISRRAS